MYADLMLWLVPEIQARDDIFASLFFISVEDLTQCQYGSQGPTSAVATYLSSRRM
jgi:hypothetical protein